MTTIFVVDDQETNRALLARLSGSLAADARVESFDRAEAVIARIQDRRPDLLITDQQMPGMSGDALIHRVRRMSGGDSIPVIVVTASDDRNLRYEVLESGATDVLTSPVDRIEFRARAQNLLSLGRRLRGARDNDTALLGWAALDCLPEAILVIGAAGEVRALNGAARRQLPDSPVPADLAGLAGQRFAERIDELSRRGEQARSEAVLRDRTGDMLRVAVRCWPVADADGRAWTCVRIEGEADTMPPARSMQEIGR